MAKLFLGDRLRHIRLTKHLTQPEFAKALGISLSYLWQVESGDRQAGLDLTIALKQKFNVNINWILFNEGDIFISKDENKKLIDDKDIPKENIKEWVDNFWRKATDKEKSWLEIEFERTFPEYLKWIQEKSEVEKKLKTG